MIEEYRGVYEDGAYMVIPLEADNIKGVPIGDVVPMLMCFKDVVYDGDEKAFFIKVQEDPLHAALVEEALSGIPYIELKGD